MTPPPHLTPVHSMDDLEMGLGNRSGAGGSIPLGMARLNLQGKILQINASLAAFLEMEIHGATGKSLEEVFSGYSDWIPSLKQGLEQTEVFYTGILPAANPSHTPHLFSLVRFEGGMVFHLWLSQMEMVNPLALDLEVLKKNDASRSLVTRLLRAEAQLDNLVHRWPGVIFSQRADLSFFFVSPRIEELTGHSVEEWRSPLKNFWETVHEADAEEVQQHLKRVLNAPKGLSLTYRIRHARTGQIVYLMEHRQAVKSETGLLLGYEGIWLDVTRQTIAERRLTSAAWKETIATLTMGLAHDFSNVMAGILALSEEFQSQVDKDHPFREGLNLIKRNSLQASQLVHRILNLHQGKLGERNYHDLNELTADIVDLVRKVVPRSIHCETVLFSESLPIYVDMVEFRQVLINLALNAVDAMPKGGKLTFRTTRRLEPGSLVHSVGTMPRLPLVELEVTDTGTGIPKAYLDSVFDPFFTTKAANKGSGLGLYNSKLFVEKHNGALAVESQESQGTTFRLLLPEADFTESEKEDNAAIRPRTFLVVAPVGESRDYLVELLRRAHHYVVAANDLEGARQHLTSPEFVISGAIIHWMHASFNPEPLVQELKKHPIKVILRIVGCNQDQLDYKILQRADLILSGDQSAEAILKQVQQLWEKDEENHL